MGVYDSITTVSVGSLSTYTDVSSSPAQRNYTYTVVAVDSCGNSYPLQANAHTLTSIHLISFPGNGIAQLIWNNVFVVNEYIPQYYIYRNNNNSSWQLIDSIGIALPTITYTDIYAPTGSNEYAVELRKLNACTAMRLTSSSSAYESSFSNTTVTSVTAIETLTNNNRIAVYPNPTKDKFTIDLSYLQTSEVDIIIMDMRGNKCVELKNVSDKTLLIEKNNLKPGVYVVEIKGEKVYRNKLVVQ